MLRHISHINLQEGGMWAEASALAVTAGAVTEAITYTKSASLHLWLLGYEFTGAPAMQGRSPRSRRRRPPPPAHLPPVSAHCPAPC